MTMPAITQPAPGVAASLLQQAMQLHQQGQPDAAEQLYQQIPAGDPQHADALHLRGLLRAQQRDWEAAQALIWQAITLKPDEAMFHNNLANVCLERGLANEAEAMYVRAIELDPGRLDALSNLGLLLTRTGRLADAEKLLARAVELAPENGGFRQNLARVYLRTGRVPKALQLCHDGMLLTPRSRELRALLALGYNQLGRADLAAEVLRAWTAMDPDDPYPRHHLAAISGEAPPQRASDAYVRDIFDNFAASFDAKLADLSYQAPQHVTGALQQRLGDSAAPLAAVLDAGCGTGLCGPLLAPLTQALTGVDLSEGMLRRAHQRDCYAELYQGELVAFLRSRPLGFDAVVSADTLCYFGALEEFAAAACTALRPGGWLVFTLEALAEDAPEAARPGHRLQHHGRYSHGRDASLAVLRGAGFAELQAEAVFLRTEGDQRVQGWLMTAKRPGDRPAGRPA